MMLHPLLVIPRLLSVPTFTTPPGTDGLSTPEFERPMISMLIKGRALLDRVKVGKGGLMISFVQALDTH